MADELGNIDLSKLSPEDLDTLIQNLESLTKKSPLDYIPYPKQQLFHKSDKIGRFLCGGNQTGKTTSGALEVSYHSTGIYPEWYPNNLRLKHANRGRIIVQDFKIFGEVVEKKLFEWLPKELIVDIKRGISGIQKIYVRHVTGAISEITVMTYEQDDKSFEGWTGNWAWFDEPPPKEKFDATKRGLMSLKGRYWITATPINEPWLYDELIYKKDDDVFFINVDIYDNPYLDKKWIEWFEKGLTEDAKEARLHGRFKHLTGLVYKMFDPAIHVIPKSKIQIKSNWPKYFVCDPHDRKPHFGIWATVDPLGTIYIFDEIKYPGTIKDFSTQILMREVMGKENQITPMDVIRILDPNKGNTPSAVSGLRLVEEFAKHAVYFTTNVNDDIALGHLAVSEKLSYDKSKPLSTTNHPKLYVMDNCRELIKYFQFYVWDNWRGANRDGKSLKERPQEAFKDFMDVVRYLIMFNPVYYEQEPDPQPLRGNKVTGYGL